MLACHRSRERKKTPALGQPSLAVHLTRVYAQPNDSSNLSKANVSRLRTEIATQITDIVAAVAIPGIVEVLLFLRTERIGTRSQEVLQHAIEIQVRCADNQTHGVRDDRAERIGDAQL